MLRADKIDALVNTTCVAPYEAEELLDRLEELGLTIYKKKVFKNGKRPAVANKLTPELAAQIRDYFVKHPTATQQRIAQRFNVNIGRVNEALEGK